MKRARGVVWKRGYSNPVLLLCVLLYIIVASRLAFLLFTTLFFLLRASFLFLLFAFTSTLALFFLSYSHPVRHANVFLDVLQFRPEFIRDVHLVIRTIGLLLASWWLLLHLLFFAYHPHSLSILFCFHSCNICFHLLCPEGSVGDHILSQLAWGGHVWLLRSPSCPRSQLQNCPAHKQNVGQAVVSPSKFNIFH